MRSWNWTSKRLIDVVGRDGGFILKGEIPKEAKPENIRAMIRTAKTYVPTPSPKEPSSDIGQ